MKIGLDEVTSKTSLSTKDDVRAQAQKKMESFNENAVDDASAIDAEISEVNGKMCILHKVTPMDSLSRLSIMYNVSERDIKQVNGIVGGLIHHKTVLNIPMTEGFKYAAP